MANGKTEGAAARVNRTFCSKKATLLYSPATPDAAWSTQLTPQTSPRLNLREPAVNHRRPPQGTRRQVTMQLQWLIQLVFLNFKGLGDPGHLTPSKPGSCETPRCVLPAERGVGLNP